MTQRLKLGKKGHKPWRYRDERKKEKELDRLIRIQSSEMKNENLCRICGD